MPVYEYRCHACGKRFERLTSHGERVQARCPQCGGRTERLLSTFAVGKSQSVASATGPCGSTDCACRAHDA